MKQIMNKLAAALILLASTIVPAHASLVDGDYQIDLDFLDTVTMDGHGLVSAAGTFSVLSGNITDLTVGFAGILSNSDINQVYVGNGTNETSGSMFSALLAPTLPVGFLDGDQPQLEFFADGTFVCDGAFVLVIGTNACWVYSYLNVRGASYIPLVGRYTIGIVDVAAVPLPAGAFLLGTALLGFGGLRRRKG